MQFFIILLLLGSCTILTRSRPSRLEETSDSERAEVEYEANDDSAADDYLREDQEPTMEEVQQKIGRREDVQQESQELGDARDSEVAADLQPAQDKYGYESLSDNNSGPRKERERHGITDFTGSEKEYISEKERSRKTQLIDEAVNKAPDNFYPRSHINRPQKDVSINGRPVDTNPEYGEMLFKIKPAQTSRQQNSIAEEAGEQTRIQQYYNNMHSKNKNHESENSLNYERDRRHAQNVEDSTRSPTDKEEADTTNENSENAIIRNIKKLSEQDLEELLNSLPDDKRALLKKIMDKREITKKAGAVDESSYLEGGPPDTSKLGGGYSVDSNTDSSMSTTDSGKQPENSDNLSSKSPDNESGSKGSASKSEIINNSDVKNNEPAFAIEGESSNVNSKNDVNINSNAEEISKNEKRETNDKDLINEKIPLDDSKVSDIQFDDFPVNQDELCSENEDWIDTNPNEPKKSNTRSDTSKREISQKETLAMQDCVKSLEESFPAANSYEDNSLDSEMAPLIRVKRTEKDHHIKKRDLSVSSDVKVHYAPRIESEDCENDEKSEFEDYGEFDRASNFIRNDQEVKSSKDTILANSNTQRRYTQFDRSDSEFHPAILSESHKKDKMSLGSDTDSVLSGVEGVDDNLMYNSGSRGKRTIDDNAGKINLNRSGRTAGPMNDAVSDNSINVSQYQDDEAFGPLPKNSEEDVSRFKRVRQV